MQVSPADTTTTLHLPPVSVGVPNLHTYTRHSGIGRVLWSVGDQLSQSMSFHEVDFQYTNLPILRNTPKGIRSDPQSQLILLPQLTGSQALASTGGVPSIVIVHDVGIVDFPGDMQAMDRLTRWSIQRSFNGLRHATAIVTVSEFTRSRLLVHHPELADQVRVIHNGVDPIYLDNDLPRAESRRYIGKEFGIRDTGPLLLYVGSEHPRKNLESVLQALAIVRSRFPEVSLVKVGRPGDPAWRANTLRAAATAGLNIGWDVQIVEGIDDSDLASFYRAADIFVSASRYEGFGLPALEAMASGTPVIVSNRGSFPEILGDAGRLVEPNPNAMARAIIATLEDGNSERRRALGRERARGFTWAVAARNYLELIKSLVDPL